MKEDGEISIIVEKPSSSPNNFSSSSSSFMGFSLGTVSLRRGWRGRCAAAVVLSIGLCWFFMVATAILRKGELDSLGIYEPTPAVSLREVLAARRALLERVCKVYETSGSRDAEVVSYPIDPSRFFYMQEPNFLFCMIPKVASLHNLAYKGTFQSSVSSSTYKALAVRHPMERLLSAYLNIMVHEVKGDLNGTNLYSNLTRILLKNYRNTSSTSGDDDDKTITFPEFVRYVVNGSQETLQGEWEYIPGRGPQYWKVDPNLNAHWLPYWRICTPCNPSTMPNSIVKLGEAASDEAAYVFRESGVFRYLSERGVAKSADLKLPWANRGSSVDRVKEFFGQLSQRDVRDIYRKFRRDHELFGYGIEPFLTYARQTNKH